MTATRKSTSAAAQAQDAQEEGREDDLQADRHAGRREDRQALLRQRAEAVADPDAEDGGAGDDADAGHEQAEQQAVLEPEARAHPVEPRVLLVHEERAV